MEILLIGNGFDLAHGLPTKYRDFLDFCQGVKILFSKDFASYTDYEKKLKEQLREDVSPQILQISAEAFHYKNGDLVPFSIDGAKNAQQRNVLQELHTLIDRNAWIRYFMQRSSCIGENWIDFESEISKAIQALDATQGTKLHIHKKKIARSQRRQQLLYGKQLNGPNSINFTINQMIILSLFCSMNC